MNFQNLQAFWYYIYERESIRINKEELLLPWPWTADPILQEYKFTNVRRVNDRTTRAFLHIYNDNLDDEARIALYNCGLYRYFGTAEWAGLIGWATTHDPKRICSRAMVAMNAGKKIFTGAYVVTNSGRTGPKYDVVAEYLGELWRRAESITDAIDRTKTWEAGYRRLSDLPGFGGTGFMAKEVLQDYLLWLPWEPLDARSFTPVGPGARRGLNRLIGRNLYFKQTEGKWISEVAALRGVVQPMWEGEYAGELTAHDIQFCLCEYDKYTRTLNGEGRPRSKYHAGIQRRLL